MENRWEEKVVLQVGFGQGDYISRAPFPTIFAKTAESRRSSPEISLSRLLPFLPLASLDVVC